MGSRSVRLILAALVFAILAFLVARHRRAAQGTPIWPDATLVALPHAHGSIALDGDTDDPGWRGPTLRTGPWVAADGVTPVHPESEARLVWGDGFLYLNLYAADEDIRAAGRTQDSLSPEEDSFHLVFTDVTTERVFDFNPLGVVTDAIGPRGRGAPHERAWDAHVHVSHEADGTPNKPDDNDEEWVLEVAIPFESLGLTGAAGERIGLAMERCDTPHRGKRVCGGWGEGNAHKVLVLEPP